METVMGMKTLKGVLEQWLLVYWNHNH
jgi:hypothetical protein